MRDDLNEDIDTLIDVALAANPEDRYPSATAMKNNINTYFSDMFTIETEQARNSNVVIGAKVAAVLLVAIAVVIWQTERDDTAATMDVRLEDKALRAQVMKDSESLRNNDDKDKIKAKQSKYDDMLFIPTGPVLIGALGQEFKYNISDTTDTLAASGEFVAKRRNISGFYIDRFEWPNRTKNEMGEPQEPLVAVTHNVAVDKCTQIGKRLCTSEEWEKACKGTENSIYSYGDSLDTENCNYDNNSYKLGGDFPECKSSYGVYGMSAGPREWTKTAASSGSRFVTKGGSLRGHPERSYRCAFSNDDSEFYTDENLSFRCCLSEDMELAPLKKTSAPASEEPSNDTEVKPKSE
jgi:formylglycine-generating enzyme required for sulfatase activity